MVERGREEVDQGQAFMLHLPLRLRRVEFGRQHSHGVKPPEVWLFVLFALFGRALAGGDRRRRRGRAACGRRLAAERCRPHNQPPGQRCRGSALNKSREESETVCLASRFDHRRHGDCVSAQSSICAANRAAASFVVALGVTQTAGLAVLAQEGPPP